MSATPRFLTLSDGNRIAWEEFGTPDGEPVIFCHGWPGSRRQAGRLDGAAKEFGFRILSFDRPGIARSTRPERRTLGDWPPLIEEAARQLCVEKFRILGVSGGGPYALITAWAMPDRVLGAATVCGAPPIAELESHGDLIAAYRALIRLHARRPGAVRWLFRAMRPLVRLPLPRWFRPLMLNILRDTDGLALRDPGIFDACYESFREGWLGSADGVFEDAIIYVQPWGFALEEIRAPVHVWHGRDDRNFRWPLAQSLAARIPGAEFRLVEGEGHYSLPFRQARRILGEWRHVKAASAESPDRS
jgi:pimeloyl-ACP methyl ester carboxylesterase